MLHLDVKMCQAAFDKNWRDWCKGGPRKEGYTRRGIAIACRPVKLVSFKTVDMSIEDALSKNRLETDRWHMRFLEAKYALGPKFYWKKTSYYWEYLKPRYEDDEGRKRASEFVDMLSDVAENGIRRPIWVADISCVRNSKVKLFRFDGCHRACCAKMCGMSTIPALLFKTECL